MVTRTPSRATSLLALVCAVFLLATACSDDSGDSASTETTAADGGGGATTTTVAGDAEPPSESPAASLRSDLTGLFEEQVYLTGFTVQAAVAGGGLDSPEAAAYVAEASDSATELSDHVGGAYGVAAGTDFLAAWTDHTDAIIAHGLDDGPVADVDSTREAFLDTLATIDAAAAFTDIGTSLAASDEALVTTVEELAAETPAAAVDLRTAADEMPGVALDLATAIADTLAVEGDLTSPEAELRADLTGLLQESAMLTGLGLVETVEADGDTAAPGPAGAFAATDENTDALADRIEAGDVAQSVVFADMWSDHIDAFEAYAVALLNDDAAGIQAAEDALVAFRDDVGELLATNHPAFTKEQVAEELVDHTDSVLAFADALVAEADTAFDGEITSAGLLRTAALNMRLAARSLTGGLTAPVADAATEDTTAG